MAFGTAKDELTMALNVARGITKLCDDPEFICKGGYRPTYVSGVYMQMPCDKCSKLWHSGQAGQEVK